MGGRTGAALLLVIAAGVTGCGATQGAHYSCAPGPEIGVTGAASLVVNATCAAHKIFDAPQPVTMHTGQSLTLKPSQTMGISSLQPAIVSARSSGGRTVLTARSAGTATIEVRGDVCDGGAQASTAVTVCRVLVITVS